MGADDADIIQFWRTVEMFSPPKVDSVSAERDMFQVRPGQPLPWEPTHALARRRLKEHQVWQHTVYVGIFSLESVFEVLSTVFPPDPDSYDERPAEQSALAAFVVTGAGRALIGSELLSACGWATGRALHPGPDTPGWLSGFEDARDRFSVEFEDLMSVSAEDDDESAQSQCRDGPTVGRPIGEEELEACRNKAAEIAGVGSAVPHVEIRVQSQIVGRRKALDVNGTDFLNSFIAEDLQRVAEQVRKDAIGPALRAYLRPNADLEVAARVDVREQLTQVGQALRPGDVPLGRWPADPSHPLAMGQQLAVNTAFRMLGTTGVMGVNGPPGTGKTTMLRDLLAALVVERARRLSALDAPGDAFLGTTGFDTGRFRRVVHLWKPELTGFEMVVASANNGAVENITKEIPSQDAIDRCWSALAEELDYFPGIATALLNVDAVVPAGDTTRVDDGTGESEAGTPARGAGHDQPRAWGLVAARLGRSSYRGKFVDAFFYHDPDRVRESGDLPLAAHPTDTNGSALPEQDRCGLRIIMQEYEATTRTPTQTWTEAVADFRAACDRAASIQAERVEVYGKLERRHHVEQDLQMARSQLETAQQRVTHAAALLHQTRRHLDEHEQARLRHIGWRTDHRMSRPTLWEVVKSFGAESRRWRRRDEELGDEIAVDERALDTAHREEARLSHELEHARRRESDAAKAVQGYEDERTNLEEALGEARTELGVQFPGPDWGPDRERREREALWTDRRWNQARSELFFAALALHKQFLQHVPEQMRQSLHAAADVVSGAAPRDLAQETALAAWQALFFVVPVVSTTFASFARVFPQLGRESLGWLLIDEAGQATPQQAVGALWRSKRAVVVGDPLQLEPITALPFRAEQAIRRDHHVDEQWLSSRTSVQGLADRLTRLGTYLPSDQDKIWVGAPLSVHRRCDQPMFGVVNDIAYGGLMINGTDARASRNFRAKYPTLPETKWIDIAAGQSHGHWIPEEGEQLERILKTVYELGFDMAKVMAIGPFRDISRQLKTYTRQYPGLVAGTIHTAQGKQADIVILILGSDPQRPGARRWAAKTPNLLNVAVSRAKRRLYVIGDYQMWADQRHFDTLALQVPHMRPR